MINDIDIEKMFFECSLSNEARDLVRNARKQSLIKDIDQRFGNCIVMHFSQKMGNQHMKIKSRTVEGPAATIYESDSNCLEFWPSPFTSDIIIKNDNGKAVSRKQHSPDFLVIRSNGFYIEDWSEESKLIKQSSKSDYYYRDLEGRWHYKPAEELYNGLGFIYLHHSAHELPKALVHNIRFLEDYNSPSGSIIPSESEEGLKKVLSECGSIAFLELVNKLGFAADDIFKAIINKIVFVDLYNDRLDSPANSNI